MHLRASLKKVGRLVGAVLVVAGLLAAAGAHRAAADNDVNLCPADRPCITELFVEGGVLKVRWSGNSEKYHLRVLTADGQVFANKADYEDGPLVWGWTLNDSVWGHTLRVSVQGCTDPTIGTDRCTQPAVKEIAMHAPRAPENVRLDGDTVHFDRIDDVLDSHPRLRGIRKADGRDVYITHGGHTVRSLRLPAGWRDEFSAIKICAVNPAGERCTDVQTRIIANPQVTPNLPPAPTTPANFRGERDGGFGTRIILNWRDASDEEYYYLTAFSAQTGQQVGPLAAPAPKLGANSTTFIVTGDFAALVGGIEFHLQACNAGGCSAPAKAVVQ
jgi:hypothetical protein